MTRRPDVNSLPAHASIGNVPSLIQEAGPNAQFAYEEFLAGLASEHTKTAYEAAVNRFLAHVDALGLTLPQVTPRMVRGYLDGLKPISPDDPPLSAPTKKLHLSALRQFFDYAVTRHAVVLNPALSVRGPKHQNVEGRTFEITVAQAKKLLASIDVRSVVGLRDRAIIATLVYTAARVGAVAKLTLRDFEDMGGQWCYTFHDKGGKTRSIPVRHDLQQFVRDYLDAAALDGERADAPLFRTAPRRSGRLGKAGMTANDMCRMVKRRAKAAKLPKAISPHSFRVCTITDLLGQDVPLADVQQLAGHSDPRTTRVYDRRQKKVSRNIVERISV